MIRRVPIASLHQQDEPCQLILGDLKRSNKVQIVKHLHRELHRQGIVPYVPRAKIEPWEFHQQLVRFARVDPLEDMLDFGVRNLYTRSMSLKNGIRLRRGINYSTFI